MAESNKPKHTQSESQRRKDELTAELARARSGMSLHGGQVAYQADVSRRLKSSFRGHVGSWLTGAVLTGGLISLLPARKKNVYINPLTKNGKSKVEQPAADKQAFSITLLKAVVPLVKPMAAAFVTKQFENMMGGAKNPQQPTDQNA